MPIQHERENREAYSVTEEIKTMKECKGEKENMYYIGEREREMNIHVHVLIC